MRVTSTQVNYIIEVITPFLQNDKAELYLYGSRVDDKLKGGDIDLLLLIDDVGIAAELASKKHYILADIKKWLGDQKIDLLIISKKEAAEDVFVRMILPTSVRLYQW